MGRSNYRPVPGYCGTRTVVATKEKDGGPPAVLQRILLLLDAGAEDVRRHGDLGRLRKPSAAGGRDVCAPSGRLSRTGIGIRSVLDDLGTGGSDSCAAADSDLASRARGHNPDVRREDTRGKRGRRAIGDFDVRKAGESAGALIALVTLRTRGARDALATLDALRALITLRASVAL